jgi:prephenate dehydrogenase
MSEERTLGILGTGLIGGSIGLRAREWGMRVIGFDTKPQAAAEAVQCGAIEEAVLRDEVYARSDIVVLAMHSQGTIDELERLKSEGGCDASLILDIASVKGPIARAGAGLPNFVPSHPMAGTERSGAAAGFPGLFYKRPWLYVPREDAALDERAVRFIEAMGGRPVPVDPDEHDAIVAMTSHLPQVVANLFARRVHAREGSRPVESFCGPTARELLRLSRSGSEMWNDILRVNRENVSRELEGLAQDLLQTAKALRDDGAPSQG